MPASAKGGGKEGRERTAGVAGRGARRCFSAGLGFSSPGGEPAAASPLDFGDRVRVGGRLIGSRDGLVFFLTSELARANCTGS